MQVAEYRGWDREVPKVRKNFSLVGGIEPTFMSNIKGGNFNLCDNTFMPAMKSTIKSNSFIDDKAAKGCEVSYVWKVEMVKELFSVALSRCV